MLTRLRTRFNDLPVRRKGSIIVAAPLLALFVSICLFVLFEIQSRRDVEHVQETLEVQSYLNRYLTLMVDGETGVRGFRLTGKESFKDPYVRAADVLPQVASELTKRFAGQPTQSSRMNQLMALTERKRASGEAVMSLPAERSAELEGLLEKSKREMDDIRAVIGEMNADAQTLLEDRRTATESLHLKLNWILGIASLFGLVCGLGAAALYGKTVAARIEALEENATLLKDGLPLNKVVFGKDEVGRLGRALEAGSRVLVAREQSLREAEAEVSKALQDSVAANKELEAFSYSVSHDLRAPLRHVAGFSDLLVKNSPNLDEKSRRYVGIIAASIKQMGTLIDELLAFSRMGRSEMAKDTVDMNALLADVMEEQQQDTAERQVEWKIGELPQVEGDRAMLRLVWTNLISNAVKYTRGREPAVIEIFARGIDDDQPEFVVKDNGAGFEMQYADKLFGVFQRLHRAEEFEGTGIGLASVRRIVHRHGGNVNAVGAPGAGAEFSFTLPKVKGSVTE